MELWFPIDKDSKTCRHWSLLSDYPISIANVSIHSISNKISVLMNDTFKKSYDLSCQIVDTL